MIFIQNDRASAIYFFKILEHCTAVRIEVSGNRLPFDRSHLLEFDDSPLTVIEADIALRKALVALQDKAGVTKSQQGV